MMEAELVDRLRDALGRVAPDLNVGMVDPAADLRNDLGLDSMDFLNFIIEVSQRFRVDIPEADYGQVTTLIACAKYVAARL